MGVCFLYGMELILALYFDREFLDMEVRGRQNAHPLRLPSGVLLMEKYPEWKEGQTLIKALAYPYLPLPEPNGPKLLGRESASFNPGASPKTRSAELNLN